SSEPRFSRRRLRPALWQLLALTAAGLAVVAGYRSRMGGRRFAAATAGDPGTVQLADELMELRGRVRMMERRADVRDRIAARPSDRPSGQAPSSSAPAPEAKPATDADVRQYFAALESRLTAEP